MPDTLEKIDKKSPTSTRLSTRKLHKNGKQTLDVEALTQAFNQLSQLFNQGAWADCEALALAILKVSPQQGAVWKVLGAIYQQQNLKEAAEKALVQAVNMLPNDAQAHYNLANFYFDQAVHDKAIAHYRKATELAPDFAIAYFNLGSVYKAISDKTSALQCTKQAYILAPDNLKICLQYASLLADDEQLDEAIRLLNYIEKVEPTIAAVHFSLGILLEKQGKDAQAISSYQKAIALEPTHVDAYNNCGLVLNRLGRIEEAEQLFKRALSFNDQVSSTYNNLGFLYKEQQRTKEAEYCFKKALVLDKNSAAAHNNYALLMLETGDFKQAEIFCLRSLEINPDYDCAHINLGLVLINMSRYEEAIEHFEAAFKTNPDHYMAMANLAIPLKRLGRLAIAEKYLKRAIEIKPDYFNAHLNLGSIYQGQGKIAECIESTLKAIEIQPESTGAYSNLLFDLSYTAAYSQAFKVQKAREFGRLLSKNVSEPYQDWHIPDSQQRLRVGLVSGDFLEHPVSYFLRNVIANIDPEKIELIAYTTDAREDAATVIIKQHVCQWRSLVGLNDAESAALIHQDDIHILIDLSGHTSGNRLPVFAHKPAPVQATWLGYWSTTGVEQIDYVIADEVSLPADIQDQFTEKVKYIPETRFCFAPPAMQIEVSPLPALKNNVVTLGCFQNFAKVSDQVLTLWAEVLKNAPQAKLRWQTGSFKDAEVKETTIQRFSQLGIQAKQLELIGSVSRSDYFKTYHEIDFLLDCFPFSGCTTTCEGLWMGVPTLTMPGNSMVSRQGASFMTAVGLANWVAKDQKEFVEKAIGFVSDLQQLSITRQQLRANMMASLVGDGQRFANNLVHVLYEMWNEKMEALGLLNHENTIPEDQLASQNAQVSSSTQENSMDAAIEEVYQISLNHQLNGEDEAAEKLYLEILNLQPRHADANHNLGFIESARQGAEFALPRFEIALTENPHSEQYWVSFIDALNMMGDTATAKEAIAQGRKMAISQENADALTNEIDTALWQKNQKLNCFSDAVPAEVKQTKFLIVAPRYTAKSAGIMVMHQLCHDLNALGYPAAIVLSDVQDVTYSNNPKYFGPNLDFYAINGEAELQRFIDEGIVIYPEIVKGNPLKAKKVVRYVLNTESFVSGNKMHESADDFILSYSPVYHKNPHALLTNLMHHPAFNDENTLPALERTLDVTYIGKGSTYGECFVVPSSLEITRAYPKTKEELALVLKNTRYFFTWDYRSATITDAIFCGAIPVFMSSRPFKSFDDLDHNDLAKNLRTSCQVDGAKVTVHMPENATEVMDAHRNMHLQTINNYDNQLKEVLQKIKKHFDI